MSRYKKVLLKIMIGNSDTNIPFMNLVGLLKQMKFDLRIKGSHYIFSKDGIEEIVNIQEVNGKAKAYQVKQIREIITKYNLNKDFYELD